VGHVTFVHGISNKPPAEELSETWRGTLAQHGLDLDDKGVSSSLVYWADLLYPEPLSNSVYESAEDPERAVAADVGMQWVVEAEGDEAAFVMALAERIGYEELASDAPDDTGEPPPDTPWERVPIPWIVKRPLMKLFLRDVHHYLFDAEFSPRPRETYKIRTVIRERTVEAIERGAAEEGPHVIVAHSLGTVIAYDCLKRVAGCPPVDALMTIGSPLGLDEVQDQLRPEWTRSAGFPSPQIQNRWVNVYDPLDPVAGFDPKLGNDFRREGEPAIHDISESNYGKWRHSITKYFGGSQLRGELMSLLDLAPQRLGR
jgi:hypothetical protein